MPKNEQKKLREISGHNQNLALAYVKDKKGKWQHVSCELSACSVADALNNYLTTMQENAAIVAWGMFTHDRKVLQTHLDPKTLKNFMLLDALKTFNSITLPKNTHRQNPAPRGICST